MTGTLVDALDGLGIRRLGDAPHVARLGIAPGALEVDVLLALDVEIGLSSSVVEERPDGHYLRELQLDLTTPALFDRARDV